MKQADLFVQQPRWSRAYAADARGEDEGSMLTGSDHGHGHAMNATCEECTSTLYFYKFPQLSFGCIKTRVRQDGRAGCRPGPRHGHFCSHGRELPFWKSKYGAPLANNCTKIRLVRGRLKQSFLSGKGMPRKTAAREGLRARGGVRGSP